MRRMVGIQSFAAVTTKVASATGATQIVKRNPSRHLVSIFNDSTAILTLLMLPTDTQADATTAMVTNALKTIDIAAGGYFEIPENYVAQVWGKWASANGFAQITEYE